MDIRSQNASGFFVGLRMSVESDDRRPRSGCPINLTLEVVGDKWSLLVIRDMIFGNYRSLVYLAQTDDPALDALAAEAAARLGLAYERRLTGYGDLAAALAAL